MPAASRKIKAFAQAAVRIQRFAVAAAHELQVSPVVAGLFGKLGKMGILAQPPAPFEEFIRPVELIHVNQDVGEVERYSSDPFLVPQALKDLLGS